MTHNGCPARPATGRRYACRIGQDAEEHARGERGAMKSWTKPGTQEEQKVLDDLFRHVAPTVGDVVATLMQQGRPRVLIGAFFERAFDGTVSGGVVHRAELAQRVLNDPRFSKPVPAHILDVLETAEADELPVVLLVARGEGLMAVGVRRARGEPSSELT